MTGTAGGTSPAEHSVPDAGIWILQIFMIGTGMDYRSFGKQQCLKHPVFSGKTAQPAGDNIHNLLSAMLHRHLCRITYENVLSVKYQECLT